MIVYLASPYSHPDKAVEVARFEQVCEIAARLMCDGTVVFCPIAHARPIKLTKNPPPDTHNFWLAQDFAILSRCDKLVVAEMDGWKQSYGVQEEILFAIKLQIPIEYIKP